MVKEISRTHLNPKDFDNIDIWDKGWNLQDSGLRRRIWDYV